MIPQTPALDSFAAYLSLGFIPQDMTPIEYVNKLLPGHYLRFSLKEGNCINSYWSYSSFFSQKNSINKLEAEEELDHLLRRSVANRLPADQKVGCLLSGGLGSASIAYYVQKEKKDTNYAFTVGFDGQTEADVESASQVAQELHLNHLVKMIDRPDF